MKQIVEYFDTEECVTLKIDPRYHALCLLTRDDPLFYIKSFDICPTRIMLWIVIEIFRQIAKTNQIIPRIKFEEPDYWMLENGYTELFMQAPIRVLLDIHSDEKFEKFKNYIYASKDDSIFKALLDQHIIDHTIYDSITKDDADTHAQKMFDYIHRHHKQERMVKFFRIHCNAWSGDLPLSTEDFMKLLKPRLWIPATSDSQITDATISQDIDEEIE